MNREEIRHRRLLSKAKQRGDIAATWYQAGNILTIKTKPEFDYLMKESDEQWELKN